MAMVLKGRWAGSYRLVWSGMVALALVQPGARGAVREEASPPELRELRSLLEGSQRVSMAEAISSTLRHNPSLQASFAKIQARAWNLTANRRRWWPTAAVQADPDTTMLGQVFETTVAKYPNSNSSTFATSTYNSSYSNYSNYGNASLGLILSWSFFDPTRQPAINSASASLSAQKLTFNAVARSLVLDTQILYHTLQQTERLIQVYERILRENTKQVAMINAQLKAGMTNVGDVAEKRTQMLNQLTHLVLLYQQQTHNASNLATNMGLTPGSAVLPLDPPEEPPPWPLSLEATIQEGLQLREEIQASLAEASAYQWDARRLVNTYLPVLMLTGTAYGYRGQGTFAGNVAQDPAPYFSRQHSTDARLGLGLRWDFLDGGIRNAEARQADFQAKVFESQAQENRLNIANQVRRSYMSYRTAKLALSGASQACVESEIALKVADKRYQVGIGDMADLIQATQLLAEAAQNLKDIQLSYSNSLAELYRYSAQWPARQSDQILRDIRSFDEAQP